MSQLFSGKDTLQVDKEEAKARFMKRLGGG